MKTQVFPILALAALTACSGNVNNNNESAAPADSTQTETVSGDNTANVLKEAVSVWTQNESILGMSEEGKVRLPDQYAMFDLDGDGSDEILLREWLKDSNITGYLALFANGKDGLQLVGLTYQTAQIGGMTLYKNGFVKLDSGNESGTYGQNDYLKIENSSVVRSFIATYGEDEDGNNLDNFYKKEAGQERQTISSDEFSSAIAGCDNDNAYPLDGFDWKPVE
ncbi:MAG: hypothetical protein J6Y22_10840 [Paludibacteraceae bacterium]|nr:hypothetical protein [Paludibacteraceae bacterium]